MSGIMSKQKLAHPKKVIDEINELRRLALQGKLSIPGSDYTKERQKWANEPVEDILARVRKRNQQEK